MEDNLQKLGWQLVECSREDEGFSAQRGLINTLFPYVYEASKRMSSRAISRWLQSSGVKLSAVTIAKALRNPKPYWQELAEEFEPAATIFSNAHEIDVLTVLSNGNAFFDQASKPPSVEGFTRDGELDSLAEIQVATKKLKDGWFVLPDAVREACLAYADLDAEKSVAPEVKAPVAKVTEGDATK